MKFKVRGEEEEVVEFWLEEREDSVVLKAGVGDSGWNLLSVSKGGVRRIKSVGTELGISLNEDKQIMDLS